MKATTYILMILWIAVLVTTFANAYEPHKQNTNFAYSFTSNNATGCNVTTGNTPSGLVSINQVATKNINTFNISINSGNFTTLGNYCYNIVCTDGTQIESGSVCIEVNPSGSEMNGWKITIEIFASVSTLFLMALFLFLSGQGIKSGMAKDEQGPSKFLFMGLSFVFLIAHILITNVIIHDTLGADSSMASSYTKVMYVFFTIIIFAFLYTLIKVIVWEVDIFFKKKGLK